MLLPLGFCGLGAANVTSYALHAGDGARAILADLASVAALPFVPGAMALQNQLVALVRAAAASPSVQTGGLVVPLTNSTVPWTSDGAGGNAFALLPGVALASSTVRVCAVSLAAPGQRRRLRANSIGVVAADSGSILVVAAPPPASSSTTTTTSSEGVQHHVPRPASPPPAVPPYPTLPSQPPAPPPNPPSPPPPYRKPTVVYWPIDQAAYTGGGTVFRCSLPVVAADVNMTHISLSVTSWSEAADDTLGSDQNAGRAAYAFATLNSILAGSQLWSPATPAPLSQAFALMGAPTDPQYDANLDPGSCALGSWGINSTAALTTLPPQQRAGQTTISLVNTTGQAAGCACAAWAKRSGIMVRLSSVGTPGCGAGSDIIDTPLNRVYWTASAGDSEAWALRQTTCGADGGADQCLASRPQAYVPNPTSRACSLRTEARRTAPVFEFLNSLATRVSIAGGSSVMVYQWSVYVVETASTTPAGTARDSFQARVSTQTFQLSVGVASAVVERLPAGNVAPQMFISVNSPAGAYGGPAYVRCLADAHTVRLVWQTNAYVQQNPGPAGLPNTVFLTSAMESVEATLTLNSIGFSATCFPWVLAPDGQQLPAGTGSTFSCAASGCASFPQSLLSTSLLSGLTPGTRALNTAWVGYFLKITCDVHSDLAISSNQVMCVCFFKNDSKLIILLCRTLWCLRASWPCPTRCSRSLEAWSSPTSRTCRTSRS